MVDHLRQVLTEDQEEEVEVLLELETHPQQVLLKVLMVAYKIEPHLVQYLMVVAVELLQ